MTFGVSQDADQTELLEEFSYKFAYDMQDGLTMTDKHGNSIQLPASQASQVSQPMCCFASLYYLGRMSCI